jgi:acetyltransferase-like isoleucine patch superfamily enzyme
LNDGAQIIARGGNIDIGENVFIGIGVIIVCQSNVKIGDNTLIAEYVVLRDQDHRITPRPNQNSGYTTAPILIGKNVWLGTKVSVLRGSNIENNVVIGAHSLVRGNIPSYSLAVGCPAEVVKKYPKP